MFWAMRWIVYTCILNYTAEDLMIEQWTDVTDIYFTEPFVPELFGDGPGVLKYFGVKEVMLALGKLLHGYVEFWVLIGAVSV